MAAAQIALTPTAGSSRIARESAADRRRQLIEWAATASLGAALRELEEAREEAVPDWSEDGDQPMSYGAYVQARQLLGALLPWAPQPAISTEPNGEPAFQWDIGADRWLIASIDDAGRISFAYRNGVDQGGGRAYFNGAAPPILVSLFSELQRA